MRSLRALRSALFAALLATSATHRTARAEAGDAEKKAAAQALFDDARALTAAGKFAEACPKFVESERLEPKMGTKYYLADCLEHIGKLASAWTYYVEVVDGAKAAGLADRERFSRERAEAVKSRLARLAIEVPESSRAAGLAIARDGVAVGEAQWGTAIPVDPGEHLIAATAAGKKRWEARINVTEEGRTITVEVPALEPATTLSPTGAGTASTSARQPLSPQRIAGIAVGAAGVVGLGLGIGFGARAVSKQGDSNASGHCDANDFCDSTGIELRRDAISAATVSTVAFALGAAAVAGGVVLFVTAPSRGRLAPQITAGPTGIAVIGRW